MSSLSSISKIYFSGHLRSWLPVLETLVSWSLGDILFSSRPLVKLSTPIFCHFVTYRLNGYLTTTTTPDTQLRHDHYDLYWKGGKEKEGKGWNE